jgi:hypothetical protein
VASWLVELSILFVGNVYITIVMLLAAALDRLGVIGYQRTPCKF